MNIYSWQDYLDNIQDNPWHTTKPLRLGHVVAWLIQQGWSISDTVHQDDTPYTLQEIMEQNEPQKHVVELYDNQSGLLDGSKAFGWYLY